MKIGILTFHRACNYGGILQCYALYKSLIRMGYDAEVIDYRAAAIEKNYSLVSTSSLKHFVSSILNIKHRKRMIANFRSFMKHNIIVSSQVYYKPNELSNKYDLCIIGSDQVWSKRINRGFDPVYWGCFNGKKASYAVSMGTDHIYRQSEYQRIERFLNNFDFLSTREDSLRDELTPYTDKDIQTVIDPTLLLSVNDYKEIAIKPKEDNYVLYYQMEYHPRSKDFVTNIAKQLGCKIITLMGPNEDYGNIKHIHKIVSEVSVNEFVGYILYARCVIASSFHGTALPIAMRKDFYFLANSKVDRSENLLRHIDALDRMKKSDDQITFTSVDYYKIDKNIRAFVEKSKDFISIVVN